MADGDLPPARKPRNRQSRGKGLRKTTGWQVLPGISAITISKWKEELYLLIFHSITCRRRHVKCDEQKPDCQRCIKANQTCIYASTNRISPISRTEIQASTDGIPDPQPEKLPSITQWHNSPEHNITYSDPMSDNGLVTSSFQPQPNHGRHLGPGTSNSQHDYNTKSNNAATADNPQQVLSPEMSNYAGTSFSLGSNDSIVPRSSSLQPTFNVAISRWFDMLVGDAAFESALPDFAIGGDERNNEEIPRDPDQVGNPYMSAFRGTPDAGGINLGSPASSSPQLLERSASGPDQNAVAEKMRWQSPTMIELLPHEHFIFRNFVQRISHWIDLFDPTQSFSSFVPHLALRNTGLMKAILALSARHISLNPSIDVEQRHDRNDALQYYNETLHYLSKAMQYDTSKTSLELLATALIVSTYEMLDGSGKDWERHLQGVFWIQRSQVIHGDSKGLKQAVWWAWLCQDVWAAFREKRKTFTFWKPTRTFADMAPYELAARSVYVIAKVVNYCSREETEAGDIAARIERGDQLQAMLDEWESYLTSEFAPLPYKTENIADAFSPIWIHPPAFAVSIQLHYSARLLLLLNKPSRGGFGGYLEQSRMISKYVNNICGIALTLDDDASIVMNSQCLFIAGLCVQDARQREAVLNMIESCRRRSGWPLASLGEELQTFWDTSENAAKG